MLPRNWSAPCCWFEVKYILGHAPPQLTKPLQAHSLEEVRANVESDVYWVNNVVSVHLRPIVI